MILAGVVEHRGEWNRSLNYPHRNTVFHGWGVRRVGEDSLWVRSLQKLEGMQMWASREIVGSYPHCLVLKWKKEVNHAESQKEKRTGVCEGDIPR